MRRFYFPIKDTTIYEEFPSREAGLDEILEFGKTLQGTKACRALVDFNISDISSSIMNGIISPNSVFDLEFIIANSSNLLTDQIIYVYPLSQSWREGQGYFYQNILEESQGSTWRYRYSGSLWAISGSSYTSGTFSSGSVDTTISKITFNITDLVVNWISGAFSNNGTVIKFSNADEADNTNQGNIKVFSRNTHTVFSPSLIVKWDDSVRNTGSFTSASDYGLIAYPSNLRPSYKLNEMVRVDVTARVQYPTKTFSSTFAEWSNSYLPSSSYYSIIDVQSNETIIPFDEYSKLSIDSNGNYFKFKIEKMYPRRFYKILLKIDTASGYNYIFDNNYYFKVDI